MKREYDEKRTKEENKIGSEEERKEELRSEVERERIKD
jgi:hypothetical protein